MQEEIDPNVALRAMISLKNPLQEGGNRTPVKRFQGRLLTITPRPGTSGGKAVTFVDLKFDQCVIMKVADGETYPFETVELSIKLSGAKNSGWGKFVISMRERLPKSVDIWDCVNAVMEMVAVPTRFGNSQTEFDPDTDAEGNFITDPATGQAKVHPRPIIAEVWNLVAITLASGVTGGSNYGNSAVGGGLAAALRVLDGKTEADFNQDIWRDQTAKADPAISGALLANTFLKQVVDEGKATLDDMGVYHVVNAVPV